MNLKINIRIHNSLMISILKYVLIFTYSTAATPVSFGQQYYWFATPTAVAIAITASTIAAAGSTAVGAITSRAAAMLKTTIA